MLGSPQATPGEEESSGPQEVLKPPHTLEIPERQQRRRRERVSGLEGKKRPTGVPQKGFFPTGGPRLGQQATKRERKRAGESKLSRDRKPGHRVSDQRPLYTRTPPE